MTAEEASQISEYDAAEDVKITAKRWINERKIEYGGDGRLDYYGKHKWKQN